MKQKDNRRNKSIEKKYLHDIAELTNLPIEKVKEVFYYYVLYMLHEIAVEDKPKRTISIILPCFCSMLLKENKHPRAKNRLQIEIHSDTKDRHIRKILEDAYFEDKDILLEVLIDRFSKEMKNDIQLKLETSENER